MLFTQEKIVKYLLCFCTAIFTFLDITASASTLPTAPLKVDDFRPEHPRLWIKDDSEWTALSSKIKSNAELSQLHEKLREYVDNVIKPTPFYCMGGNIGRRVHERVGAAALIGKTLDPSLGLDYLNIAVGELMRAVDKDCLSLRTGPHDLRYAEYAAGVALGYDWLYDLLTKEQKEKVRIFLHSLVARGLGEHHVPKSNSWTRFITNINSVCNSGFGLAALAILGEDVESLIPISSTIDARIPSTVGFDDYALDLLNFQVYSFDSGLGSFRFGLEGYRGGDWFEGPVYWYYATRYAVMLMSAIESAHSTQSDLALPQTSGFLSTMRYPMYSEGSANRSFNFSDAWEDYSHQSDGVGSRWHDSLWFGSYIASKISDADEASRARYLAWESLTADLATGGMNMPPTSAIYQLIMFEGTGDPAKATDIPTVAQFSRTAFLRSDWSDESSWLGVLAGKNDGTSSGFHDHLDIGTFVYQADGIPWAVELGLDNYGLTRYGKFNEDYYRVNTSGHNTISVRDGAALTLFDQNQLSLDVDGLDVTAQIEQTVSMDGVHWSRIDMSEAYQKAGWDISHAHRGVALLGPSHKIMLVQDKFQRSSEEPSDIDLIWRMYTRSDNYALSDNDRVITLDQDGEKLKMFLLEPKDAKFEWRTDNSRRCNILANQPAACSTIDPSNDECICEYDRSAFKHIKIEVNSNQSEESHIKVLLVPGSTSHFSKDLTAMESCINQLPNNCIYPSEAVDMILREPNTEWAAEGVFSGTGCWRVNLSNGSGFDRAQLWQGGGLYFQNNSFGRVKTGDFDGNNLPDLIHRGLCGDDPGYPCWRVNLNLGGKRFAYKESWAAGVSILDTGDTYDMGYGIGKIDGDNYSDLTYHAELGGTPQWGIESSNGIDFNGIVAGHSFHRKNSWSEALGIAVGDFDGDGDDDLVYLGEGEAYGKNGCANEPSVWRLYRGLSFSSYSMTCWGSDPLLFEGLYYSGKTRDFRLQAGDFNGDGIDDILYRGQTTSATPAWLVRHGSAIGFDSPLSYGDSINEGAYTVDLGLAVGDFDGNNLDDFVYRGRCGNEGVECWRMNLSQTDHGNPLNSFGVYNWGQGPLHPSGPDGFGDVYTRGVGLTSGDYNNDGLDDIAYWGSCRFACGNGLCEQGETIDSCAIDCQYSAARNP